MNLKVINELFIFGKFMIASAYSAARTVSTTLEEHFSRNFANSMIPESTQVATKPDAQTIESLIDAAFWASLQREEGYSPKISLAFLSPEQAGKHLMFEKPVPLSPKYLAKLSPAVERPGIHLGVWRNQENQLMVWGTTRTIPILCFVLEVIEPGLLVVKYRRGEKSAKFANVLVINGDQIKEINESGTGFSDCPHLLSSMLRFGPLGSADIHIKVLIQLATSMRTHHRGGSLLIVPKESETWRESVIFPTQYSVQPPFSALSELVIRNEQDNQLWHEEMFDVVEAVAGLTAIDGATVVSNQFDLLAFGVKIARRSDSQVDRVITSEPVIGNIPTTISPTQLGGTRHLSAAQFIYDQHDAISLVASQDGRFTIFAWSPCDEIVHAHRIETLLL